MQAQLAQAQALGITAVPSFVIDGRYLIQGAQPPESFARRLTQIAAGGRRRAKGPRSEAGARFCDNAAVRHPGAAAAPWRYAIPRTVGDPPRMLLIGVAGTELSPQERDWLQHDAVAGVVLFKRNFASRARSPNCLRPSAPPRRARS